MKDALDVFPLRHYAERDGMNLATARKRRQIADVGLAVPPGTWLLTEAEWQRVRSTPLPGCTAVRPL